MEHVPKDTRSVLGGGPPPSRRLDGGGHKIQRIAEHSKGLLEDVKAWVELKLEHAWLEVQSRLDAKREEVMLAVAMGVMGLLAFVFALVALALGLGAWLGHPAWGFLLVTVLLLLIVGVLRWYGVRRRREAGEVVVAPPAAPPSPPATTTPTPAAPPAPPGA